MDSPVSCAASKEYMTKTKAQKARARAKRAVKQQPKQATVKQVTKKLEEASLGRKILRAIGGTAGGAMGLLSTGTLAGAAAMAKGGYDLGNQAATIMGMGAYSVKKNSLKNASLNDGVPYMHSSDQSVIVRHQEFLGNVVTGSSNTFNISSAYSINPGQPDTFPWLSSIAINFQEYSFKGLAFYFKSTASDAIASSTNLAMGTVIMGTRYNPVLGPFTGKVQMLNEYYSNDCKPSHSMIHLVECDPAENPFNILYVRSGGVPTGASVQNYDLGTFYIATAGFQGSNVTIGELYVTYEVELKKPTAAELASYPMGFAWHSVSGLATGNFFGTYLSGYNNWFGNLVTVTPTTITIPPGFGGRILMIYTQKNSVGVPFLDPGVVITNASNYLSWQGNTQTYVSTGSITGTTCILCFTWTITQADLPCPIVFSGVTPIITASSTDVFIFPISDTY